MEQDMVDMFKRIDVDNNQSLSLNEVILFLKSVSKDISVEHMEHIFHKLDKSGDRMINYEEFKVPHKREILSRDTEAWIDKGVDRT